MRKVRSATPVILCVLMLSACSGIGQRKPEGPDATLAAAWRQFEANKIVESEQLMLEALKLYERQGDPVGEIDAHLSLGELYRSEVYLDALPTQFERTYVRGAENSRAMRQFEKAAGIAGRNNYLERKSEAVFQLAEIWRQPWLNGNNQACNFYMEGYGLTVVSRRGVGKTASASPYRTRLTGFDKPEEIFKQRWEQLNCENVLQGAKLYVPDF